MRPPIAGRRGYAAPLAAATLALLAATGQAAAGSAVVGGARCRVAEVTAFGRAAHGATIMRHAAPHRLIRALDRLPAWRAGGVGVAIVGLEAAPAINVIPPRAVARLEIWLDGSADDAEVLGELGRALGSQVEVRPVAATCGSTEAPPAP